VLTDDRRPFISYRSSYSPRISIIAGGHRIEFAPPKGLEKLIPGFYRGAKGGRPFNEPGIEVYVGSDNCTTKEGQFRILEIQSDSANILRLVADFETNCSSAIGRISYTSRLRTPPLKSK
jgi:hypothetical protein